jgi:hypothetical protein
MFTEALRQAGIAALISIFMGLVPLGFGILYAVKPNEQRLALMRPLSLAAIFGVIHSVALGVLGVFRNISITSVSDQPVFNRVAFIGLSESLVPIFFGFGCLMLAWLCVAVGMWRRP